MYFVCVCEYENLFRTRVENDVVDGSNAEKKHLSFRRIKHSAAQFFSEFSPYSCVCTKNIWRIYNTSVRVLYSQDSPCTPNGSSSRVANVCIHRKSIRFAVFVSIGSDDEKRLLSVGSHRRFTYPHTCESIVL